MRFRRLVIYESVDLSVDPNANAYLFHILIAVTTPNDNALACQIRPPGPIGYGIFMKSGSDAVSTSVLTLVRAELLVAELEIDDIIVGVSSQVVIKTLVCVLARKSGSRSGYFCPFANVGGPGK